MDFWIDDAAPREAGPREALLDRCFGPERFLKTCERLREGRRPAAGLALSARSRADGALIGTVRLWHVLAGAAGPALMLGPLAVDPTCQAGGVGSALMRRALSRAGALGHRAVLLVGDPAYYARFGFSAALTTRLVMPGPVEAHRLQGLELVPGALATAAGAVVATGALTDVAPTPLAAWRTLIGSDAPGWVP